MPVFVSCWLRWQTAFGAAYSFHRAAPLLRRRQVACLGLQPCKHLGRTIAAMEPTLLALADAYGCNVCGEGGEYETLTLDCSVFSRGCIEMDEYEVRRAKRRRCLSSGGQYVPCPGLL